MAAWVRMAFSNASRVRMSDGLMSALTISTILRPVRWARVLRRASTAGRAPLWGRHMPSASTRLDMVEAVPMVLQTPKLRLMPASALMKSARVISPARTASEKRQTSVPEPMSWPWNLPFNMGPDETTMDGRSTLAAPISRPGGGLVAAAQQHHPVDGVGANGFLHLHGQQVAKQHGRGPHLGLGQAHGWEFDRHAAGLPDTLLHMLGQVTEATLAGDQFRPGVADADDRAPVEGVVGQAGALHPAAMDESVAVQLAVALGAAQGLSVI